MFTKKQKEVLISSIEFHGIMRQLDKLTEECGELIQAIQKIKYEPEVMKFEDFLAEIADVEILIKQIKIYYRPSILLSYDTIVDMKINRLDEIIGRAISETDE